MSATPYFLATSTPFDQILPHSEATRSVSLRPRLSTDSLLPPSPRFNTRVFAIIVLTSLPAYGPYWTTERPRNQEERSGRIARLPGRLLCPSGAGPRGRARPGWSPATRRVTPKKDGPALPLLERTPLLLVLALPLGRAQAGSSLKLERRPRPPSGPTRSIRRVAKILLPR